MIGAVARGICSAPSNDRRVRKYQPRVDEINALEPELVKLSDEELCGEPPDSSRGSPTARRSTHVVPAFATVREAAKRALGMRHFDVQMIGGMILHEGKIDEMRTGEGKTLVATLAGLSHTRSPGAASMSSPSTIISRRAIRNGWGGSIDSSV